MPIPNHPKDELLNACIRRANLDTFWSRSSDTVYKNMRRVVQAIKLDEMLGLPGTYNIPCMAPFYDHAGYQIAYRMLLHSRQPGVYSKEYTQFATVRKHRSAQSNFTRCYPSGNYRNLALGNIEGKYNSLSDDPCSSLWFTKFIVGCRERMGQIWRPDKAMSLELLLAVLERSEYWRSVETDPKQIHMWSTFTGYVAVSYCISLRGNEGFLMNIEQTVLNKDRNDGTFFYLALFGKIKGEGSVRLHLVPVINVTGSGIKVKYIVDRMIKEKKQAGLEEGFMIADLQGKKYNAGIFNGLLYQILEELFETRKNLFPPFIKDEEDILASFHCFRTFRKTSDTRALNQKVDSADIDVVNRWSTKGTLKAAMAVGQMRIYYAQPELLIEPFLRYGSAM